VLNCASTRSWTGSPVQARARAAGETYKVGLWTRCVDCEKRDFGLGLSTSLMMQTVGNLLLEWGVGE
jgi:hypothetical protein